MTGPTLQDAPFVTDANPASIAVAPRWDVPCRCSRRVPTSPHPAAGRVARRVIPPPPVPEPTAMALLGTFGVFLAADPSCGVEPPGRSDRRSTDNCRRGIANPPRAADNRGIRWRPGSAAGGLGGGLRAGVAG